MASRMSIDVFVGRAWACLVLRELSRCNRLIDWFVWLVGLFVMCLRLGDFVSLRFCEFGRL